MGVGSKHFPSFFYVLGAALVFSCATGPAETVSVFAKAPPEPVFEAEFTGIEAERPESVRLRYELRFSNPRKDPITIENPAAAILLDGRVPGEGTAVLGLPSFPLVLDAGESRTLPAVVSFSLESVAAGGPADVDTHRVGLEFTADYSDPRTPGAIGRLYASADAEFPRIREPVFTITGIAVKRAELINTRLIVSLRIDNPNSFPVALSSLGYELYGGGRFWADGALSDVLEVPARGSAEKKLFLVMNFINMRRELLNQIIALREVEYRFSGTALVGTGVSYLPSFSMRFDKSGNSAVVE